MADHIERNTGFNLQEDILLANNVFAFDLYKKAVTKNKNLFLSPFSISSALAMTYAGAHAETKTQMSSALHFPENDLLIHQTFAAFQNRLAEIETKGAIQINTANSLWPQKGYDFLTEFLDLLKKYYGVIITPLDFAASEQARSLINNWVLEKTRSKIREIIPEGLLDGLTRLVLVNAIYFKGDWDEQFDKKNTQPTSFFQTAENVKTIPMMHKKGRCGYYKTDGLQVLELPYSGKDISLLIFLPDEIEGLPELETNLNVENVKTWTSSLRHMEVRVFLPRFEITSSLNLTGILHNLGMVDAFGKADFSGMDGTKQLYIAAVLHKAFIKVNEEGSEAAAATAVIMKTRSIPLPAPVFQADHPFLFIIRENNSGSILFIGRVYNPE